MSMVLLCVSLLLCAVQILDNLLHWLIVQTYYYNADPFTLLAFPIHLKLKADKEPESKEEMKKIMLYLRRLVQPLYTETTLRDNQYCEECDNNSLEKSYKTGN